MGSIYLASLAFLRDYIYLRITAGEKGRKRRGQRGRVRKEGWKGGGGG